MRYLPICLVTILSFGPGCGGKQDQKAVSFRGAPRPAAKDAAQQHVFRSVDKAGGPKTDTDEQDNFKKVPPGEPNKQLRKIKYTAEIGLVTEDFAKTQSAIEESVKAHEGYIASTEVGGTASTGRHGHWRVRIPVKEFD